MAPTTIADPEAEMEGEAPLVQELAYFHDHRQELVERHLWKYVLVRGDRLVDSFDSPQAADDRGAGEFGLEPFLVRQVTPQDAPTQAPALYTGLVSLQS
jgi:hypothetical protein